MAGRKSTAAMELAIGATIIAGVVILIVMLLAWGNSTSLLGSHYRVVVNMTNVGGLKEGAPVKMGGFQIGRVASIQIKPGSTDLELVLDIDDTRNLPMGSKAKISTAGLVGDAFMEIVPGKSTETIPHATSVAEAERIESSPLPDMSEMMTRMADIGQQVKLLTENLNSILGDEEFKNSVKSMVKNIDSVGHQANQLLQRSRGLIENVEVASKNAAELSATLKGTVDKAGGDITRITGNANELLATVKTKAEGVIDNLNAGITDARGTVAEAGTTMADVRKAIGDARNAINSTVGNPEVAKNLTSAIANINSVTGLLAKRNDATEQLLLNLGDMTADLKAVSSRVREITGNIDPASVSATLNSLNGAIASMTDMVEKVKSEPVLALSINKAADRIVKMKFDEMAKQQIRGSEPVLDEINRWVREGMDKGVLNDPAYSYEVRPYAMPEVEARQAAGDRAAERRPYLND